MTIAAASGGPFALTEQPLTGCNFCVPPADVDAFGLAWDFAPMLPADPAVASVGPAQARPAATVPATEGFIPASTGGGGAIALPGAKIALPTARVDFATTLGLVADARRDPPATSPLQQVLASLSFRPAPNAATSPRFGIPAAAELPAVVAAPTAAMSVPPVATSSPAAAPTAPAPVPVPVPAQVAVAVADPVPDPAMKEAQAVPPVGSPPVARETTKDRAPLLEGGSAVATRSIDRDSTPGQAAGGSAVPTPVSAPSAMPQPAMPLLPAAPAAIARAPGAGAPVAEPPVADTGSPAGIVAPPASPVSLAAPPTAAREPSSVPPTGVSPAAATAIFDDRRMASIGKDAGSQRTPVAVAIPSSDPARVVSAPDVPGDNEPVPQGPAAPSLAVAAMPPAVPSVAMDPDRPAVTPHPAPVRIVRPSVADADTDADAPDTDDVEPLDPSASIGQWRPAPVEDAAIDGTAVAAREDQGRALRAEAPSLPEAAGQPPSPPPGQPSPQPPAVPDDDALRRRGSAPLRASGLPPVQAEAAVADQVADRVATTATSPLPVAAPVQPPLSERKQVAANAPAGPRAPRAASADGDGIRPVPVPVAGNSPSHGDAPTIASPDPVPLAAAADRVPPPDPNVVPTRTDPAAPVPAPTPTVTATMTAAAFTAPPAMTAPGVPSPPVAALPGRIGRELGVTVARHLSAGGGEAMTVRLAPAEMGRIAVRLSFDDDGTLRASVSAEHAVALNLLRRDSTELNRALADAGLKLDGQTLRFETEARSGDGERPGGGWSSDTGQNPRHDQGREPRHPASPYARARADGGGGSGADPAYRTPTGSGRVDLMA